MEEKLTSNDYDDEISLIDLFAVLIRFRKLIILGTAIVTFLAGCYLYVLPKIKSSGSDSGVNVQYFIELNNLLSSNNSLLKKLGVTINISNEFSNFFEEYHSLAEYYQKHPFLGPASENKLEYNQFIINTFGNNAVKNNNGIKPVVLKKSAGNQLCVECKFSSNYDNASLKAFLIDYIAFINEKLNELALENIANSYRDFNIKLETEAEAKNTYLKQNLSETVHDIETFEKSNIQFASLIDEPFVTLTPDLAFSKSRSRAKKLIIVFFASAFLFVFIAFANNAVINIKNDPESNKKITDAWKQGK